MKRPKKLTREQKEAVYASGYLPDNWMLEKETEFYLYIIHKITRTRRRVDRYAISKKGIIKNDKFRRSDNSGLFGLVHNEK